MSFLRQKNAGYPSIERRCQSTKAKAPKPLSLPLSPPPPFQGSLFKSPLSLPRPIGSLLLALVPPPSPGVWRRHHPPSAPSSSSSSNGEVVPPADGERRDTGRGAVALATVLEPVRHLEKIFFEKNIHMTVRKSKFVVSSYLSHSEARLFRQRPLLVRGRVAVDLGWMDGEDTN